MEQIKIIFKDCNLLFLEKTFKLKQVKKHKLLSDWIIESEKYEIDEYEKKLLIRMQDRLIYRADDWNELELVEQFIAPLFNFIDFNDDDYGMFSERLIKCVIDNYEIYGYPDAIVAKGRREPEIPYFCFHEYKKETENKGDPKGQCLAAMLVAQELNNNQKPIYGVVVKGKMWEFMILQDKEFAVSRAYNATIAEIFEIIKLLKHLKTIIEQYVKESL